MVYNQAPLSIIYTLTIYALYYLYNFPRYSYTLSYAILYTILNNSNMSSFINKIDFAECNESYDILPDILPDDFDDIGRVSSPYRLTRRTNIAYDPETIAELRRDIEEHNALVNAGIMSSEDFDADLFIGLEPIPMVRQEIEPKFVIFSNGLYIDQDGNLTTPEEHGMTHENVLSAMAEQERTRDYVEESMIAANEHIIDIFINTPAPIRNMNSVNVFDDVNRCCDFVPFQNIQNEMALPALPNIPTMPPLVRQTNRPDNWVSPSEEYPELNLCSYLDSTPNERLAFFGIQDVDK